MWVQEIEPRSSGQAASAPNHEVISSSLKHLKGEREGGGGGGKGEGGRGRGRGAGERDR
jgi:hypothetical protein